MKFFSSLHVQPATPELLGLTRRGQLQTCFSSFLLYAFAAEAGAARPGPRMAARDWVDRQAEIARALRRGELNQTAWMMK